MESSGDDYSPQLLSMLPPFLQSRLPIVPARLRSFRSLQSSIASTIFCNNPPQTLHRCEITATLASNSNNNNASTSSYTDSASSDSAFSSSSSRRLTATSLSSILANEDDLDSSGETMAEQNSMDDMHYEHLMRRFLRSVREMETRRQLDNRRLLEGSEMRPMGHEIGYREPRLPRNFNERSHDAVDQRWSPSGIKWRYARQGAQLATDASNELHDASFERSAYIDAVAYYLRACPNQLDHGETAKLLAAAPWLAQQTHPEAQIAMGRPTDRGRTFLSDAVQYAVIGLILLGHMLWCCLLSAFRIGAYFERQYHVSEWVTTNGYDLVNTVGKHSVTWTARLNSMNDGRISQVVSWTMDSVTGGIQEGYGKGMDRIRRQHAKAAQAGENHHMAIDGGGILDLRRSSRQH